MPEWKYLLQVECQFYQWPSSLYIKEKSQLIISKFTRKHIMQFS